MGVHKWQPQQSQRSFLVGKVAQLALSLLATGDRSGMQEAKYFITLYPCMPGAQHVFQLCRLQTARVPAGQRPDRVSTPCLN